MTADARDYALDISELLFRLTTESIRLRSNETGSHESLSSLMLHLVSENREQPLQDADILRHHLKIIPTKGKIVVRLGLSEGAANKLEALMTSYDDLVAGGLTAEDMLSLLLFDYVADQKAARVLGTLGLRRSSGGGPGEGSAPSSH